MNAAALKLSRHYPLYAKTCALLACLVALMTLFFVCTRIQLNGAASYRQTAIALEEAARLQRLAATVPSGAAELTQESRRLIRNDTLLDKWRQRGAPTPELGRQLAALDRACELAARAALAHTAAPGKDAAGPASERSVADEVGRLGAQVRGESDMHLAMTALLQAATATLIVAGIAALAGGARLALVARPTRMLRRLVQAGHEPIDGRDEIDRMLQLQNDLSVRLRSEQDESARLKHIVEDHIAFADQSLDLLHYICAQLAEDVPSGGTLEALLQRIVGISGMRRIALVLSEPSAQLLGVDVIVSAGDDPPLIVRGRIVHELMALAGLRAVPAGAGSDAMMPILAAPVRVPLASYGVLIGEGEPDTHFEPRHLQLMETVASVLAHAISNLSRDVRDRRTALLAERGAIARELHDSLAQSLSYMKIQVARLQAVLPPELGERDVGLIAQAIREGIDSAYRQLRELLTTFRTSMHAHGLASSLEDIAEELSSRSQVQISVDNRIRRIRLSVNEELHVAQIVREALTNVIHHARASNATVQLSMTGNEVKVQVEDDGRGIQSEAAGEHHYGLTIMRERARSLGGRLSIGHGTSGSRVSLTFVPAALRTSS